jgi:hypothetical protein
MSGKGKKPEARRAATIFPSRLGAWDLGSVACHLTFVVFSLALLWRPLFGGEAFFWGTPLLQFVPWQQLAADMWRSGHLPLWNPLVGCGAPLAANYQTGAFYPLNALHLLMRAEVALSWTVAIHLALTGWGMYRWGSSIGLDKFPAFVGALALEGSGFLVARAALFPSIALTFPWLAIWLWRGEVLMQSKRLHDALWLGLALGLGLLAGHAQTASYGGLLLGAYVAFRALQEARGKLQIAGLLVLSLVLGLGLAAVQLLPTAELLMASQRSTGVRDDFALTYSFWPWRLITFAAPDFFGNPGRGAHRGSARYWGYATYWEDAGYIGVFPLLLAVWAVIAAVGGTWRRSKARRVAGYRLQVERSSFCELPSTRSLTAFWGSAALISLLLAFGKNTPVFPFLFRHLPGFDLFQAPARWLAVTSVAMAALAGIGAHRWPRGHRGKRLGAFGATAGGALLIGGLAAPHMVTEIPSTFGPATVRLGMTLLFVGGLALLRPRDPNRNAPWWYAAVGALIAVDLLTIGWPLVPTVDRNLYQGTTSTATALRDDGRYVRVYWPTDPDDPQNDYDAQYRVKFDYLTFEDFGPEDAAYWRGMREAQLPNAGMLDRIASANNFDPLLIGRYSDALEAAVEAPGILRAMGVTHVATDRSWPGGEPITSGGLATFYRLSDPLGRAWIVPEARRIASDSTLKALTDPAFDPGAEVLLEVQAPLHPDSSATAGAWQILSLQDAPNEVTIGASLEAPGTLVLADTWYPGWKVTVDGEPAVLLRANHAFRAVQLEAGEHMVEMIYRAPSVWIGGLISLAAAVSLIVCLVIAQRQAEVAPDNGRSLVRRPCRWISA